MNHNTDHIYCKTKKEQQKPFMISVSEAIIYKNTMMIKFLNTTVAKITVVCIFWP